MEKVTIVDVVGATSKNGKTYYKLSLDDGRKGTSFNAAFLALKGKTVDVILEKNGEYNNFDLPKEEKKSEGASHSDNIKLEIAKAVLSNPSIPSGDFVLVCNDIYNWVKE